MMGPLTFNTIALGVGSGVVGGAEGPLLPHEVGGGPIV